MIAGRWLTLPCLLKNTALRSGSRLLEPEFDALNADRRPEDPLRRADQTVVRESARRRQKAMI
jgi:hypothetical protein